MVKVLSKTAKDLIRNKPEVVRAMIERGSQEDGSHVERRAESSTKDKPAREEKKK